MIERIGRSKRCRWQEKGYGRGKAQRLPIKIFEILSKGALVLGQFPNDLSLLFFSSGHYFFFENSQLNLDFIYWCIPIVLIKSAWDGRIHQRISLDPSRPICSTDRTIVLLKCVDVVIDNQLANSQVFQLLPLKSEGTSMTICLRTSQSAIPLAVKIGSFQSVDWVLNPLSSDERPQQHIYDSSCACKFWLFMKSSKSAEIGFYWRFRIRLHSLRIIA